MIWYAMLVLVVFEKREKWAIIYFYMCVILGLQLQLCVFSLLVPYHTREYPDRDLVMTLHRVSF